jgi:proline iminopeptidase
MKANVRGHELEYVEAGHGRRCLTLHGGLGFDHNYMQAGLTSLNDVCRFVHFDQYGNGRSTRPTKLEGGLEFWADDAEAVRASLGLGDTVLFGHSFGGFIAQECVLRNPSHVTALVLCCTAPALDYPDVLMSKLQARGSPRQVADFGAVLTKGIASDAAYAEQWPGLMPLYFHRWHDAYADKMNGTHYSALAFNHGMAALATFNTSARLGEIRVPTLILAGRDDFIAPVEQGADRLHRGIPGSERVVFESSGHFPFFEEPERFADVVRTWMNKL